MSAEEKNLRFEHDGPTEITVDADDGDPTEDGDESLAAELEKRMAWEGVEDAPLLYQVGRIAALSRFAKEQYAFVAGLQEHGVADDTGAFDVNVSMKDVQVLS